MPNLLVNPSTINVSPWIAVGTGVSALSGTTIQTGASASSVAQTLTVAASTTYTASCFVSTLSGTNGSVSLTAYKPDYSTNYGTTSVALTTSPQLVSCPVVIPSGITSITWELDYNSTASATETITACFLGTSTSSTLMMMGCGS
jgi:hypothetical protein